MKVKLNSIKEVPTLQLRSVGIDRQRVDAMVEFVKEGGVLPPITLVGDERYLADGHHRLAAAVRMGADTIESNIEKGGLLEATGYALRGNDSTSHLPLKTAERNRGIAQLLDGGWTQGRIGDFTGLAQTTISHVARSREAQAAYPNLSLSAATAVASIGAVNRKNSKVFSNVAKNPVAVAVAEAVEDMETADVRRVVRTVNDAMRNGKDPDVAAIVAVVRPAAKVETPYEAYEELKRRFLAFRKPIIFNGETLSIGDVVRAIMQNPDAEELRPYMFANEPVAQIVREQAELIHLAVCVEALAPDADLLTEGATS